MSDQIKHECGIALIRLRKPLDYYFQKYKTPSYALNKLYILMEKQHNRGQDGVGVASVKIDLPPGMMYIDRYRTDDPQPIQDAFRKVFKKINKVKSEDNSQYLNSRWMKENVPFVGEVVIGHLRYGTHGKQGAEYCHPMLRRSNWRSRNLMVAGNFNMTNVDAQFNKLIELGQHPKEKIDTVTVLEKIGHFLDDENQRIFDKYNAQDMPNIEITKRIEEELDLQRVLQRACKDFDGGYAMMGLTGYGAAFVARDPAGIRPAYYYADDEVIVVASEKPAIKTAFDIEYSQIREITPGSALIISKNADYFEKPFIAQLPRKSCSFERIYFSRSSDPEIYHERKKLGLLLTEQVLEAIDYDLENTVFSYIPNTAETAFLGLMEGLEDHLIHVRQKAIEEQQVKGDELRKILAFKPRVEKLVIKDAKMRTFITDDDHRDEMVSKAYDTTYEVIKKGVDTVVVLDDSIVRGTTLEKRIISLLHRLEPRRIVIVSSAPQIRYPDCYGIDMSVLQEFVAFRAALKLLEEQRQEHLLYEIYARCKASLHFEGQQVLNHIQELYGRFSDQALSDTIARIVRPEYVKAEVKVVYQTVENLHKACPGHLGDWYFTGDYPTPGGNRVANQAFMNFIEGKRGRSY